MKLFAASLVALLASLSAVQVEAGGLRGFRAPRLCSPNIGRAATRIKPFPNATTGIKGRALGVPYEIGMRNTTISDIGWTAVGYAYGWPPGASGIVAAAHKKAEGQ